MYIHICICIYLRDMYIYIYTFAYLYKKQYIRKYRNKYVFTKDTQVYVSIYIYI